jgi:hypothetical protein
MATMLSCSLKAGVILCKCKQVCEVCASHGNDCLLECDAVQTGTPYRPALSVTLSVPRRQEVPSERW